MFELQPHCVVHDLANISMDHYVDGRMVRQHLHHEVIDSRNGWAVVLVAFRTKRRDGWTPPQYFITRWSRIGGAWRRTRHFPVKDRHLVALVQRSLSVLLHAHRSAEALDASEPRALRAGRWPTLASISRDG